jgi:hypothetical protein
MIKCSKLLKLCVLAILIACSSTDSNVPLGEDPFIVGELTEIKSGKVYNAILVEENPAVTEASEPGGAKIWLTLTKETEVFTQQDDGSLNESSTEVLKTGLQVKGWVSGPVDDAYPRQGLANRIIVVLE